MKIEQIYTGSITHNAHSNENKEEAAIFDLL
jgi:hypothetical protein